MFDNILERSPRTLTRYENDVIFETTQNLQNIKESLLFAKSNEFLALSPAETDIVIKKLDIINTFIKLQNLLTTRD